MWQSIHGGSILKYLAHFKNWDEGRFFKGEAEDATTLDFLTNRNAHMLGVLNEDFKKYRGGGSTGSYAFYEKSLCRRYGHIDKAVESLPQAYQAAISALKTLEEKCYRHFDTMEIKEDGVLIRMKFQKLMWDGAFGGNGELVMLKRDGKDWLDGKMLAIACLYDLQCKGCVNNYYSYNKSLRAQSSAGLRGI